MDVSSPPAQPLAAEFFKQDRPPDGFVYRPMAGQFANHNARFYGQWREGNLVLGFRVEAHHGNVMGICHGGMLATFADTLLGCGTMYQALGGRHVLPTVSLQIDYMSAAREGQWVEGEIDVMRRTRTLAFVRGIVTADGEAALSLNAIFRIGAPVEPLDPDFLKVKSTGGHQ